MPNVTLEKILLMRMKQSGTLFFLLVGTKERLQVTECVSQCS